MRLELHIFHHFPQNPTPTEAPAWALDLANQVRLILSNQELTIMPLLDDLETKMNTATAEVAKLNDKDDSMIAMLSAYYQQLKDLRQALADAGTDQGRLQKLGDAMDAMTQNIDARIAKQTDAINANTDPAPGADTAPASGG